MIFTVRDLGFEIGPFFAGGLVGAGCPGCLRRCHRFCGASGRLAAAPEDLSRSAGPQLALCRHAHPPAQLQSPLARMAFYSGLYLALTSLPWAIPGLTKFLFTAYKIATTLLFCQGLYNASEVADLLLASCSRRSGATRPCAPCWTPPTRCWSSFWVLPPARRSSASPSAAS